MPVLSMVFGVLLVLNGLYGYFNAATPSKTALIPSGFGMVLVICGALALAPAMRKHAMHAAAGVSLVGFLMAAGRAAASWQKFSLPWPENLSVVMTAVMGLLCGVFLALCVQSFIAARRARRAAESA